MRRALLLIACPMLMLTASCETTSDVSCLAFRPLRPAMEDTADTKRQILGHNRAFRAVCG
jgi:hypothetical protein